MKKYEVEKQGQIEFFETFRIDYQNNDVLIDYTDGVWNGNLLEFKLNITNINKVLFQAIKYLSKMRIRGESVPANILLISLNQQICYYFKSEDYFDEIHKVYFGASSKNNESFVGGSCIKKINYSNQEGVVELLGLLRMSKYMPVDIDENCIVGWAERYYSIYPKAAKGDFIGDDTGKVKIIGEIRNPKLFKGLINPYTKKSNEKFKNLMDKLNDKLRKKTLGAFYTPIPYCVKAKELLELAIKDIPKENDYIILDRCAGTGNLESVLTDEQLSHCVLSTYEYYEYKVLCERLADKVRLIIPPVEMEDTYNCGFVSCADAMSEAYINNPLIRQYIDDPKCNIILYENPPYNDTSSITGEYDESGKKYVTRNKESYVFREMSKAKNEFRNSNISTVRDFANRFIWSAYKYYLIKTNDSYIVFSPVKYFKSLGIIQDDEKKFVKGYIFNRKWFHATPSGISCVLWSNSKTVESKFMFDVIDIDECQKLRKMNYIEVKKVNEYFNNYQEKYKGIRSCGLACNSSGYEEINKKIETISYDEDNVIAYFCLVSASFDLGRLAYFNGRGFYLTKDNFFKKLPLFCAKKYPQNIWYEKDVVYVCADKGDEYTKDTNLLKCSLIYTCLSVMNHCLSFTASNNKVYLNELCFDDDTLSSNKLREVNLSREEQDLMQLWTVVLSLAKETKNYNSVYKYGVYQISNELNTYTTDENGNKIYDYNELNGYLEALKTKIKLYYEKNIAHLLFKYELLK
ncbi:MAG: hypothetical protein MR844_01295 [Clostridia bacterium]|nr:hypothetical protein [Clostridia bacterium]